MVAYTVANHLYGTQLHPLGVMSKVIDTDAPFLHLTSAGGDPDTYTTSGYFAITHAPPFAGLVGVVQYGLVHNQLNTIIYPRALGLNSATGRLFQYSLWFEPHRWVTAGTLIVQSDDATPAYPFSSHGGGEMPTI